MQRREFLKLAAIAGASSASEQLVAALPQAVPIVDAHIHLFDPSRPGGVPWPEKTDPVIYKPALPDRLETLAAPLGVVGAIAIEASPLESDNSWLLQVVSDHPFIVGCIGDLVPGAPGYRAALSRFHANPLFLGIRYGNLWDRNLAADLDKPGFWEGLADLADSGLVLETANPNPELIAAALRVAERLPHLRIVVDHLPHASIPASASAASQYWANVRRLGQHPQVFVKLSEVPVRINGSVPMNAAFYAADLDRLWRIFGDDRVLFGSDWPNSDHLAGYGETLGLMRHYVSGRSLMEREKFFWRNSLAVYRWRPRRAAQRLTSIPLPAGPIRP